MYLFIFMNVIYLFIYLFILRKTILNDVGYIGVQQKTRQLYLELLPGVISLTATQIWLCVKK